MAYDQDLADRVREYLYTRSGLPFTEKKMFGGLAFLVGGKMCVNVSGSRLMCRFDPARHDDLAAREGYAPMIMRGKHLEGYCYVEPQGFCRAKDFDFWLQCCLSFHPEARKS